jgi:hypothetical protein
MKRFMYLSIGVLCLSVAGLIGFHVGTRPAHAQLAREVAGIAVDASGSTVFVLEADGDVWARGVEYLDLIDGYGTYVPPCRPPHPLATWVTSLKTRVLP